MDFLKTKKTEDGGLEWKRYIPFDINATTKKVDPVKKARNFAKSDLIIDDEAELNSDEKEILSEVNGYVEELNEVFVRSIGIVNEEIESLIEHKNPDINLNQIYHNFNKKVLDLTNICRGELAGVLKDLKDAYRNLNDFKNVNDINRPAEYPESIILHFSIVLAGLLFEGLTNSYFYSQVSSFGFLGGLLAAFFISFSSVLVAFLSGVFFLRYSNHINIYKKIGGLIGFLCCLCFLTFAQLAAAHYREILSRNPDAEIYEVLGPLWEHPFNLSDLESLLLIAIGVAISAIAIWKGYTIDDRYPRYGKAFRNWKNLDNRVLESRQIFNEKITAAFHVAMDEILGLNRGLNDTKKMIVKIREELMTYLDSCESWYDQACNGAQVIIGNYRNTVQKIYGESGRFTVTDKTTQSILREIKTIQFEEYRKKELDKINERLTSINEYELILPEKQKIAEIKLNDKYSSITSSGSFTETLDNIVKEQIMNEKIIS